MLGVGASDLDPHNNGLTTDNALGSFQLRWVRPFLFPGSVCDFLRCNMHPGREIVRLNAMDLPLRDWRLSNLQS